MLKFLKGKKTNQESHECHEWAHKQTSEQANHSQLINDMYILFFIA